MIGPARTVANPGAPERPPSPAEAKLRESAQQLEGVFLQQLFKAMRETVPEGGLGGGSGEEMFTGLMDEQIAADTPKHWERGLGEALYRALRARLPEDETAGG